MSVLVVWWEDLIGLNVGGVGTVKIASIADLIGLNDLSFVLRGLQKVLAIV